MARLANLFQKVHPQFPQSSSIPLPDQLDKQAISDQNIHRQYAPDHLHRQYAPDHHLSAGQTNHQAQSPASKAHGKPAQDFCNAFWGETGFEILMSRVKQSSKMLEDLKAWYKERSSIELEYSKKLYRLGKSPVLVNSGGNIEGTGLKLALDSIRQSTEKSAHSHAELAGTIKTALYDKFDQFINSRDSVKKNPQATVEKLRKNLLDLRILHEKARKKYEADAIATNGYVTQLQLAQGRDFDKVSNKLDKVQMSIKITDKEYRTRNKNLQETTNEWNTQWKMFCDLVQDLEEDRVDFIRNTFWDYANGISAICVAEDEQCEQIRISLERCDTTKDIKSYVRQAATGNEYSLAPTYVNYAVGESPRPVVVLHSNYIRSSTRKPLDTTLVPLSTPIQDLVDSVKAGPLTENRSPILNPSATVWENKIKIKRGGAIADSVASNSLGLALHPTSLNGEGKIHLTADNLTHLQKHLDHPKCSVLQPLHSFHQQPASKAKQPDHRQEHFLGGVLKGVSQPPQNQRIGNPAGFNPNYPPPTSHHPHPRLIGAPKYSVRAELNQGPMMGMRSPVERPLPPPPA